MSENTIKFYFANRSNFEYDFNFKASGYENDLSNYSNHLKQQFGMQINI